MSGNPSTTDAAGSGRVLRLRSIAINVADPAATEVFYRDGLGFELLGGLHPTGAWFARLTGLADASATALTLQLGRQQIELVSWTPPGRAYPAGSTAADLWFQHFAIVVADMDAAYAILRRLSDMRPISEGGPQKLPPNTGSVTAFKFRDRDGHPLELSFFPPGVGAPAWHETPRRSVFLGIDHSAISVADPARSIAFYAGLLGMEVAQRSLNRGPEQARLDGLASDGVDIVALQPADPASPHVELLGYHGVARRTAALGVGDIAATRLILQVQGLDELVERLRAAGVPFVSPGVVDADAERAALVRDPDGHLLMLVE